ncbi:MAG: hypothetical protein ABIJ21_04195 [Nanoarchaeota archaeon]
MIFDFFRKKTVAEIAMADIDRFFAEYIAKTALQEEFMSFVEFFEEKKGQAKDALEKLSSASPKDRNYPPRALHLLHGNKKHFLQEMGHLLQRIRPPEDLLSFSVFHQSLGKEMTTFTKATQKNYLVINELLGEELSLVLRPLKELEESSSRLDRRVEKKHIRNIAHIKKKLEFLEESRQAKQAKEARLGNFASDLDIIRAKKKKVFDAIEKIKKGERYGAYLVLERSRAEQEKKVKAIRREINLAFAEVERVLKRLRRDMAEGLLDTYLNDAPAALLDDVNFAILSFLEEGMKLLPGMNLGKKEQKAKKAMARIERCWLEANANSLRSESDVLSEMEHALRQNASLLGLQEQEGYLSFMSSQEEEAKRKVDSFRQKVHQYDEAGLMAEINELLLPLGARIIV